MLQVVIAGCCMKYMSHLKTCGTLVWMILFCYWKFLSSDKNQIPLQLGWYTDECFAAERMTQLRNVNDYLHVPSASDPLQCFLILKCNMRPKHLFCWRSQCDKCHVIHFIKWFLHSFQAVTCNYSAWIIL